MPKGKGARESSLIAGALDTDMNMLEKGKDVNTASHKTVNTESPVSLTIKVPASYRRYWQGKAKMEGVTVKSVVIEALERRFGIPPQESS